MGCSWLVHPLPLRERVGRGVAPASSTLRTRRLVVPSPLTPTLSRKGRGSQKSLRTRALLLFQRYWPLTGSSFPISEASCAYSWVLGWIVSRRARLASKRLPASPATPAAPCQPWS